MKRPLAVLTTAALAGLGVGVPLSAPAPADPSDLRRTGASASWKDSTLTVRNSWDNYTLASMIDVLVDGVSIEHSDADKFGMDDVEATVARKKAAGPAHISIVASVCSYGSDYL